jgi:protein-tyrosine-phosphatase
MPSVLFVCTANRFRSPLSAAFFQSALPDSSIAGDWRVDSAGTWASPGYPVLPEVSLIARKYALDLAGHRSKPVTGAMLSAHDLVLVMEDGHREALHHEFPGHQERIHLLSQVTEGRAYNIPDLIDSLDSMMEVARELHNLIQNGTGNICNLALHLQDARDAGLNP